MNYNINVNIGDTFSSQFTVRNSDNSVIDLTSYSVTGIVRNKWTDSSVLLPLGPTIMSPATSGIINISIPQEQITGLPVNEYVYSISIFNRSTDYSQQILNGYFKVQPGIGVL